MSEKRIQTRIKDFSEKSVSEKIGFWHRYKAIQDKKKQCVSCGTYGITGRFAGLGKARFTRHSDGRLTISCGKRDGKDVCPGYTIQREPYVDQVTVVKEIQSSMRQLRRDLKIIRDRVLATQTLDEDDKKRFSEMSEEYAALKTIEEIHKEQLDKIPDSLNTHYIDTEILVPSAYFGDTQDFVMKTPMLPNTNIEKTKDTYLYPEQTIIPICKEDIPVRVLIDEGADDE